MNIYIACALTQVPRHIFPDYARFIHALASTLNSSGDFIVKYALVHSDPDLASHPPSKRAELCYLWDRQMVEDADILVAEASFPSTGLGIELQLAESRRIPTLICYHDFGVNRARPIEYQNPDHTHHSLQIGEDFVSLMALGLPNVARVIRHNGAADGITQIVEAAKNLVPKCGRQRATAGAEVVP